MATTATIATDRTRSRRFGWCVLSVTVILGLTAAGCSSDDTSDSGAEDSAPTTTEPAATTTTSTSTTTTTTTTTTAPVAPEPIPIDVREGWELVWHDEFDGDEIDPTNWTYDIGGWGWGNGEAQYYTSRLKNARVQNGLLVIEAHQEKYEGSYYTSARLLTQGLREFQYGRVEARLKVPAGRGLWPAFWMLGSDFVHRSEDPETRWPNVGEIDIMEYVGREPDLIMGTIHGPGYQGATGITKWNRQDYPIADDYHTYAIEWDYDGIRWFYDGELYSDISRDVLGESREWVFDDEFFIILNLAVGGLFPGPIDLALEFPVSVYVDYVRVYQTTDGSASEA